MRKQLYIDAKRVIALSFLIVALSIAYYFMVYLPKIEAAKAQMRLGLQYCLQNAQEAFHKNWTNGCKLQNEKEGCSLPKYLADDLGKRFQNTKDDCFKIYPQK